MLRVFASHLERDARGVPDRDDPPPIDAERSAKILTVRGHRRHVIRPRIDALRRKAAETGTNSIDERPPRRWVRRGCGDRDAVDPIDLRTCEIRVGSAGAALLHDELFTVGPVGRGGHVEERFNARELRARHVDRIGVACRSALRHDVDDEQLDRATLGLAAIFQHRQVPTGVSLDEREVEILRARLLLIARSEGCRSDLTGTASEQSHRCDGRDDTRGDLRSLHLVRHGYVVRSATRASHVSATTVNTRDPPARFHR